MIIKEREDFAGNLLEYKFLMLTTATVHDGFGHM